MELARKYDVLRRSLEEMGSVAVAFSAGVDSTLLLETARLVLGPQAAAVTVRSCFVPRRELNQAESFCRREGIRLICLDVDVLQVEGVRENPPDRCYLCKKALFSRIKQAAEAAGLAVVAEGSNADDLGDYRPGMRAVRELGVRSPLLEAGLTKAEIRALSKELGLSTWDKPAMACLATRFPTGTCLEPDAIARVEHAEELLRDMGLRQLRVRMHGELARIELAEDELPGMEDPELRLAVDRGLKELGFRWVCLDLAGYRTGSMNILV